MAKKSKRRKAARRGRKPRVKNEQLSELVGFASGNGSNVSTAQPLTLTQRANAAEAERDKARIELHDAKNSYQKAADQTAIKYDQLNVLYREQNAAFTAAKNELVKMTSERNAAKIEIEELRRKLGVMEGYIQRANEDEIIREHGVAETREIIQRREGPNLQPRWKQPRDYGSD